MRRLALVTILCSAMVCYAQHGGGGGHGGGPPAGMGGGMGNGAAMGNGTSADRGQMNRHDNGSQQHASPQELLNQNTKLASNLQKLLPAGLTPQQACAGFKNLGGCVAAIHVAHNLDIPFLELKDKLTGADAEGLGQAIQQLDPKANAGVEKKKAEKQAKQDLES
jgi:hypothetical protein